MKKCCGGLGSSCLHPPEFQNENGVLACLHHRLLIDAFNWESHNKRAWHPMVYILDVN